MDISLYIIHGKPPQLHGQVRHSVGWTAHVISTRYTLSAVLDSFSEEMCPDAEDGECSFTKQGLLQTALVVVYLAVSMEIEITER